MVDLERYKLLGPATYFPPIELTTGVEARRADVVVTMFAIDTLRKIDPIGRMVLVDLARLALENIPISFAGSVRILQNVGLLDQHGVIPENMKQVVIAALHLVDGQVSISSPIKEA